MIIEVTEYQKYTSSRKVSLSSFHLINRFVNYGLEIIMLRRTGSIERGCIIIYHSDISNIFMQGMKLLMVSLDSNRSVILPETEGMTKQLKWLEKRN